ncbi:MarR family transcriptional regulator [Variovorax sp. J22R133]|uniref:MarR family winged helix-turn-helix transcriptional regulator n=1 Tax=Variovorax brevis TaxID=3053503 RepID=UPI0025766245|nr:MarR family transcriptional regulator [Variovorax sp. J22R133]MDM0112482.1 MarR family transcriptional regulator [Variovorax sp. J22R133]
MSRPSRLDRLLSGRPPEVANAIAASRMLFRVAHLLEARIDEALKPLGIDMREYLALVLIADDAVEPVRPSDLSTTLDATRTQVTRLLDGLEKKGLAQRLPGRGDRRSLELSLTDAARDLLRRAAPSVHEGYQAGWGAIGAEGTRQSLGVLRRLHKELAPSDES